MKLLTKILLSFMICILTFSASTTCFAANEPAYIVAPSSDYRVLNNMSKEELNVLVKLILDKTSERLTKNSWYKQYQPDHTKYTGAIADELMLFGGNSFANVFRGHGVEYRETLIDVCKKLDVNFNKKAPTSVIEECLLNKVLTDAWNKMSKEEQDRIIEENRKAGIPYTAGSIPILIGGNMAGFAAYTSAVVVANAIAQGVLGTGLSLATNAALTESLGILLGPVGWAVSAAIIAVDVAGPSYKVTAPAMIYISAMKRIHNAN